MKVDKKETNNHTILNIELDSKPTNRIIYYQFNCSDVLTNLAKNNEILTNRILKSLMKGNILNK
jgi:hypothetical protein